LGQTAGAEQFADRPKHGAITVVRQVEFAKLGQMPTGSQSADGGWAVLAACEAQRFQPCAGLVFEQATRFGKTGVVDDEEPQ